jgi:adenylosuccinate synthase
VCIDLQNIAVGVKSMPSVVVVGLQWGDEAKGKIVAGHTVVLENEVYKFYTVPVGILNPNATPVIADGVVIDPGVLVKELKDLKSRGIAIDKLKISPNAHVIMPYHRLLDQLEEERKAHRKLGTTGVGIGPCYMDKMARIGIRMSEFIDIDEFSTRLTECLRVKNEVLTKIYGAPAMRPDEVFGAYEGYAKILRPYVTDVATMLHKAARSRMRLVFEGAHGSLLDIDHGTYPYVTSSHTVAGGACIGTGVGPTMIDRVAGICKAYTTRVGEGWFPTELTDETGEYIRERGKEYGTTTGRPRRCGWFDAVAVRHAARMSGAQCMAVVSLDVLSGLEEVRICSAYRLGPGKIVRDFPSDPAVLNDAMPVYDDLPGWKQDISGAQTLQDLPASTRDYLRHLTELVGVPIAAVSVGRRRDQTILVRPELMRG